jgi:hypothetical protein
MRQSAKPSTQLAPPPRHAQPPVGGDLLADAAQAGLQQIRTRHITAVRVQVPRTLEEVERAVVQEAALMGEDYFYAWDQKDKSSPTGKKLVKGISIDGASMIMRNWTNCTCEIAIVEEGPSHWVLEAIFIDFEKGVSFPRLYRQRKTERHGRFDDDRALDIAFQIGQSKAQRNAIDKGMPQWLINKGLAAATDAANKKYEDVPASIKRFQQYARKIKVTDAQLEDKIGKPFKQWTPADCVEMAAVLRGLQQQLSTVEEEFPPIRPEDSPDGVPVPEQASVAPAAAAGEGDPGAGGQQKLPGT